VRGEDADGWVLEAAQEFVREGLTTPAWIRKGRIFDGVAPDFAHAFRRPRALPGVLLAMGDRHTGAANYRLARHAYQLSYESAALLADLRGGIEAAQRIGRTERFRSQWKRAERWYRHAARLADRAGTLDLMAIAWDGLGNVALMRGKSPVARKRFGRALFVAEASGDALAIARASHSLMLVETNARNWEAAAEYGWRAAQLHPSREEREWALLGLIEVLIRTGTLDLARKGAQHVVTHAHDHERRAMAMNTLGRIAALSGDEAGFLRARKTTCRDGLSAHALAQMAWQDGDALAALGRWEEATRAARAAISISEEAGLSEFLIRAEELQDRLRRRDPTPAARSVTFSANVLEGVGSLA